MKIIVQKKLCKMKKNNYKGTIEILSQLKKKKKKKFEPPMISKISMYSN